MSHPFVAAARRKSTATCWRRPLRRYHKSAAATPPAAITAAPAVPRRKFVGRTGASPVRTISSSGTGSRWARCNKWVSAWYGVVITVCLLSCVAVSSVLELHSLGVLMLALPEVRCQALCPLGERVGAKAPALWYVSCSVTPMRICCPDDRGALSGRER